MPDYIIEVIGTCRELYCVTAANEDEALDSWHDFDPYVTEVTHVDEYRSLGVDAD